VDELRNAPISSFAATHQQLPTSSVAIMANIKRKKGQQAPEPEENTLTLIEEGPARSSRAASPPRRLGNERIRRASSATEKHQMHSLQREGRTALLEMPLPELLTDRRSCHRRRAATMTRKRAYQIRPMGSNNLLQEAIRAFTPQKLLLNPILLTPVPLLC
jgi:hypothetical protein